FPGQLPRGAFPMVLVGRPQPYVGQTQVTGQRTDVGATLGTGTQHSEPSGSRPGKLLSGKSGGGRSSSRRDALTVDQSPRPAGDGVENQHCRGNTGYSADPVGRVDASDLGHGPRLGRQPRRVTESHRSDRIG